MRFNGNGTLISSENSFLALSYSVEQETERGLKKESKFHCQKTRAREKIAFCVLQKMRITLATLIFAKKTILAVTGKSHHNTWQCLYSQILTSAG